MVYKILIAVILFSIFGSYIYYQVNADNLESLTINSYFGCSTGGCNGDDVCGDGMGICVVPENFCYKLQTCSRNLSGSCKFQPNLSSSFCNMSTNNYSISDVFLNYFEAYLQK